MSDWLSKSYTIWPKKYWGEWLSRGQGVSVKLTWSWLPFSVLITAHIFLSVKALLAPSQGQSFQGSLLRSPPNAQWSIWSTSEKKPAWDAPKSPSFCIIISLSFISSPGRLEGLVTHRIILCWPLRWPLRWYQTFNSSNRHITKNLNLHNIFSKWAMGLPWWLSSNPPSNAGDTSLIPGPGRSHRLQSN